MPRKIGEITRQTLEAVPLPNHASTYTVISHKSIIDYAYQELANQGFGVSSETYKSTLDGQIARGIHTLHFNSDPELSMMFGWTNSYNKQVRFQCIIGAYINNNGSIMVSGEMGSYARKHTGTADADVIQNMKDQITNAYMYYNQLIADKERMKTITLTTRQQAELLGVLFAEYEILTTEQASTIRQQMGKPSFFYNGGKDTLWAFYNHVTVALQESHPRTWMEDQRMLHWVISNEFGLNNPVQPAVTTVIEDTVDPLYEVPNQTNILDQIDEISAEEGQAYEVMNHDGPLITEGFDITLADGTEVSYDMDSDGTIKSITMTGYFDEDEIEEDDSVISLEPTQEDSETFNSEESFQVGIVDLNENTKQAVIEDISLETSSSDFDFDLSFDLNSNDDEEPSFL